MTVNAKDVGPVYDLLLATRDGSTLPCRNKDGQTVNLSSLAFMTSVNAQNQQHEETELQHKDSLIQLGSSNLIDREFDQWPQVTQGDWSGGGYQRVLSGSSPVTSFVPQSDPTRYWDGTGILWPTFDYLPQSPLALPPLVDTADVIEGFPHIGPAAGTVNGTDIFCFIEHDITLAKWFLVFHDNSNTRTTVDITAQSVSGNWLDLFVFNNWAWLISDDSPSKVYFAAPGLGITLFTTLSSGGIGAVSAFSIVGTQPLVAINETSTTINRILLYNITNLTGTTPLATSVVPLPFDVLLSVTDMNFQGDTLILSLSDNNSATLVAYNISTTTFTTVARFPGAAMAFFTPVMGSLFVIALESPSDFHPTSATMYLVTGNSAQIIGPLRIQLNDNLNGFIFSILRFAAVDSYAVFAVIVQDAATNYFIVVSAYDVALGRLFKLAQILYPKDINGLVSGAFGQRLALKTSFTRPFLGANRLCGWEVIWNRDPLQSANAQVLQELLVGVQDSSGSPLIQQGTQIISSIIDFTSAQHKLYRQVVATFLPLVASAGASVTLDVWLDQDPASLNASPDFTTTINGITATGATRLVLLINKVAIKLVYRVTTTGGNVVLTGTTLAPAPKLVSVVTQAATGWTRTMMLDLADNVVTNSKAPSDYAWSRQQIMGSPAIDGTAAYNFIRLLWRLKGGEVTATFPNGDPPANWLLQDQHFDSPKPFGVSFRADQKSSLGYLCTLKLREDI